MGDRVDVLDNRPKLYPDLERPYYLIRLWLLGRREYAMAGVPLPINIRAVREVFDCFQLGDSWTFDQFAGYVLALDRCAMEHLSKSHGKN